MLGRNKMYKKGLADAMHGYEDFGKKQEDALRKIRQEVSAGNKKLETALAEMGENIFAIFDLLDKKEKEALYHLHTPMDILDLEESERKLLIAILCRIIDDEQKDGRLYNEYQNTYFCSLKKYLAIVDLPSIDDYDAIENIDSMSIRKVFMRVILEFLYLQTEDELTDRQQEIFKQLSVSEFHSRLIECEVIREYKNLTEKGLAVKYETFIKNDQSELDSKIEELKYLETKRELDLLQEEKERTYYDLFVDYLKKEFYEIKADREHYELCFDKTPSKMTNNLMEKMTKKLGVSFWNFKVLFVCDYSVLSNGKAGLIVSDKFVAHYNGVWPYEKFVYELYLLYDLHIDKDAVTIDGYDKKTTSLYIDREDEKHVNNIVRAIVNFYGRNNKNDFTKSL